jgi:hypothetical protein
MFHRRTPLIAVPVLAWLAAVPACNCESNAQSVGVQDLATGPTLDVDAALANPDALFAASCATGSGAAARDPVYLLFVLDGSYSMTYQNKWTAVTAALDAIFDQFQTLADPSFGVGFTIFADTGDPTIMDTTAGPYDKMDVPIAFVDATQNAKLRARIDNNMPKLGTPTYEVLSGQFPLLESYMPAAPLKPNGRRVLVFITDGVPDPDMPAGANEAPYSLALVKAEAQKTPAIQTFAIGVGQLSPLDNTVYDPAFMGQLAVNGGVPRQPCDPTETVNESNMCHFQITPGNKTAAQLTQEFVDTINTIRLKLLSCEFALTSVPGAGDPDPNAVNVVYTSGAGVQTIIGQNSVNGWTYDDPQKPTKVILNGPICDTVKMDPGAQISIVLGCQTIVIM